MSPDHRDARHEGARHDSRELDARLAEIRALLGAGETERAESLCRALATECPDLPAPHHLLGFIRIQRGNAAGAVRAFERAVGAGGNAPDLHLNLGAALIAEGRADEAARAYEAAVARAPDWPAALNGLGVALQEAGRLEPAARAFERAQSHAPDDLDVLVNLGAVRTRLGRHDEAIDCLAAATAAAPDDAEALCLLGDACRAASRWHDAAASYERAARIAPEMGGAHRGLGGALEHLGDGQGAADAYQRALDVDTEDVEALAALGGLLREAGQTAEAVECLRRAAALRPEDVSLEHALRGALSRQLATWHWPMIADEARNDAYRQAIENAVDASSVVLDIGTGTGLLAMMAARAGARRVYACEMSAPLVEVAREVVQRNGLAERIEIIHAPSTALRVGDHLAEPATVLVSEIVDVGLLAEGVLPTVRDAAARLLAPGAKVIPARATVYARLVTAPGLRAVNPVRTIAGFDLSPLDRLRDPDAYLDVDLARLEHRTLSPDVRIASIDLARPAPAGEPVAHAFEVRAVEAGLVSGVAMWFELHLDEAVAIDTRPGGPITAWGQALHFLDADVPVRVGQLLRLEARVSDTRVDFRVDRLG